MIAAPLHVVLKVYADFRVQMDLHDATCERGGQVVGIAVSPHDHERLGMVDVCALPVLEWTDVRSGDYRLICDGCGTLTPVVDTPDDLFEFWRDRPATT